MRFSHIHHASRHEATVLDYHKKNKEEDSFASCLKTLQGAELSKKIQTEELEQKRTQDFVSHFFTSIGENLSTKAFPIASDKEVKQELKKMQTNLASLPKEIYNIAYHNAKISSGKAVDNELSRLSLELGIKLTDLPYSPEPSEITSLLKGLAYSKAKKNIEHSKMTGMITTFVALGVLSTLCVKVSGLSYQTKERS